jgi:hypothetical protein
VQESRQIEGLSSPFDPNCSSGGCRARARDWAVDVTIVFGSANSGVEVGVQAAFGDHALDEPGPKYRFP